MRHSKLFLGALTLTLGIAGAVATMAANVRNVPAKIFTVGRHCITIATPCPQVVNGITCVTAVGVTTPVTVWTVGTACTTKFLKPA